MAGTKTLSLSPALITIFALLMGHGVCQAQDLTAALPAPLVVTLDGGRLKEAGLVNDAVEGQAIQDAMAASGANLVLFRAAVRANSENADITDQVIARVRGATDFAVTKAFAPRLEVLDMAAAKKFGATQDETTINNAVNSWMRETNANLVLDKQAVLLANADTADVTGTPDVTGNVIATITHKPAQATARPLEGRVMVISRTALLQYSKAGRDISRQVQAYIDTAKRELGERPAELKKKGTALQEELPTLSRDETALRVQAFKGEEEALQASVQLRDAQIRNGMETARHVMEQVLGPVLTKMMKDRGVDLVLDLAATPTGLKKLDPGAFKDMVAAYLRSKGSQTAGGHQN